MFQISLSESVVLYCLMNSSNPLSITEIAKSMNISYSELCLRITDSINKGLFRKAKAIVNMIKSESEE